MWLGNHSLNTRNTKFQNKALKRTIQGRLPCNQTSQTGDSGHDLPGEGVW